MVENPHNFPRPPSSYSIPLPFSPSLTNSITDTKRRRRSIPCYGSKYRLATPSWRHACVGTWKPPSTPGTQDTVVLPSDLTPTLTQITSPPRLSIPTSSIACQPLPCFNLSLNIYIRIIIYIYLFKCTFLQIPTSWSYRILSTAFSFDLGNYLLCLHMPSSFLLQTGYYE